MLLGQKTHQHRLAEGSTINFMKKLVFSASACRNIFRVSRVCSPPQNVLVVGDLPDHDDHVGDAVLHLDTRHGLYLDT